MYVVKYTGPFGFIKPWTAVRDEETYSQQFLTFSTLKGIELKLFPELLKKDKGELNEINRYKLTYTGISVQQETVQAKAFAVKRNLSAREKSILKRGVLINPTLYLGFKKEESAKKAFKQHICLCRNEDVLLPIELMEMNENNFNELDGFELQLNSKEDSFLTGFDRYNNRQPMYGILNITGKPVGIKSE